jgi:Predicted membrane protein involved in D-alanine export
MRNFAFPYFSRDMAEFWRRWHISLSTWFRDYLYFPLGGSQGSTGNKVRNIFIIFIVSGFWHGANWTFIVWGLLNAIYFLPLLLLNKNRANTNIIAEGKIFPSFREFFQIGLTFSMTTIAWIFFRSNSISAAFGYIKKIFTTSLFTLPKALPGTTILLLLAFILTEWLQRDKQHALQFDNLSLHRAARWSAYYAIIFIIIVFAGKQQEFIYFQF